MIISSMAPPTLLAISPSAPRAVPPPPIAPPCCCARRGSANMGLPIPCIVDEELDDGAAARWRCPPDGPTPPIIPACPPMGGPYGEDEDEEEEEEEEEEGGER